MERLNQPPNTECCSNQGQAKVATSDPRRTSVEKHTQGTSQAVSGSRTSLKQSSLETVHAGGDVVASAEPNTEAAAKGEAAEDLPGSKRMAREERVDGNLGDPEKSRRANYGSQSGRSDQRQEESSDTFPGVRSAHSSQDITGQGADIITQPAQETRSARTAVKSWVNLPVGHSQQSSSEQNTSVRRPLSAAQPRQSQGVLFPTAERCGSRSGRSDLRGI